MRWALPAGPCRRCQTLGARDPPVVRAVVRSIRYRCVVRECSEVQRVPRTVARGEGAQPVKAQPTGAQPMRAQPAKAQPMKTGTTSATDGYLDTSTPKTPATNTPR